MLLCGRFDYNMLLNNILIGRYEFGVSALQPRGFTAQHSGARHSSAQLQLIVVAVRVLVEQLASHVS